MLQDTIQPLYWTDLSDGQRAQGIHPEDFTRLRFNLTPKDLSEEMLKKFQQFFTGCRLATSETDFTKRTTTLIQTLEGDLEPIRKIAQQILRTAKPREYLLEKPEDDSYDLHFEGEGYGSKYIKFKNKVGDTYNQLMKEQEYLLHPARRNELVSQLQKEYENPELIADRLITYRCRGYYALWISELERKIERHANQLKIVESQIETVFEGGPKLIKDLSAFTLDQLSCIPNERVRKHVHKAFLALATKDKLDILELSEKKLYHYLGGEKGIAHPDIEPLAADYWREANGASFHYGMVIKYLKTLRNSDLKDLLCHCLYEEKNRLTEIIAYDKNLAEKFQKEDFASISKLSRDPDSFSPGDFSFIKMARENL